MNLFFTSLLHFAPTLSTQNERKNQNDINYYIISKRVVTVTIILREYASIEDGND